MSTMATSQATDTAEVLESELMSLQGGVASMWGAWSGQSGWVPRSMRIHDGGETGGKGVNESVL